MSRLGFSLAAAMCLAASAGGAYGILEGSGGVDTTYFPQRNHPYHSKPVEPTEPLPPSQQAKLDEAKAKRERRKARNNGVT